MSSLAWPSSHDLPDSVRQQMIVLLNRQLADTIDLSLQAKQAHWNVKGPLFVPLHALFDEMAGLLTDLADELAERAVELGGIAQGTSQAVVGASGLPAYDQTLLAGDGHLQALKAPLVALASSSRMAIDAAAAAGDATTADLFTEASRTSDKLLWKLSAHAAART